MKSLAEFFVYLLLRFSLSLRYKIRIKGKKELKRMQFPKKGGILFLANHPAEIDPCILLSVFWYPFKPHPVAIDYLFRKPFVRTILNLIGALPVPNFDNSSNSYKRREIEKTYEKINTLLDHKKALLIYPGGGLKNCPNEIIGGASGVHTILEARPDTNIVLIRTTGLWGSSFSRAPTGKTPDLLQAFLNGFKVLLKNFIFFAPRRHILIECTLVPDDFPWKGERREQNRYLEEWYNAKGPEPLYLVSFSRFKKEFPLIKERKQGDEISLDKIPEEIKREVLEEISNLTRFPPSEITAKSHLALDLGLDSLDTAQLVVFLRDTFGISSIQTSDLTDVASVYGFAARLKKSENTEAEEKEFSQISKKDHYRPPILYPEGDTLIEIFLKTCDRMDNCLACVDQMSGEISYKRLKTAVILLAESIRKMPGKQIGVMMPASVAVNALIFAILLAGKIPVMINWTLGERNLRSIVQQSQIQSTLSSWSFLDRLENAELNGLDDQIILLEDLRGNLSLFEKARAWLRSRKNAKKLLKIFKVDTLSQNDFAVILFTSGTESYPKGVPLTHRNLTANHKAAQKVFEVQQDDILLGALPPFHSFGFSVTGIFPLLAGLRCAYQPNPTDGKRIALSIKRWNISLICLAPTFLRNLLRSASNDQLQTLRFVVAGAEKTATELFEKLESLNPHASLLEGYGITECSPILTLNLPEHPVQGVGPALPGVEIEIVDPETLEGLNRGEQGLILARGPNVFHGYLDPKLPSPFVDYKKKKWYRTGDLGVLDENGYLTLTGRLKRFVKIGGEMISLGAIEETLFYAAEKKKWELDPERPSLAVCSLEEEGKKGEIHLFTTFETSVEEVNQILKESGMSNLNKIVSTKKLSSIPLLGSGKIDYKKLTEMIASQLKSRV